MFMSRFLIAFAVLLVAAAIAELKMDKLSPYERSKVEQILFNLVDNACKFMGGRPEPRIEIGVRTRGSERVVYVRDNGIGIEPRDHESIFGLFEKLDPKSEGTGIGLATVRRIIELHGGRVWVESDGLGKGSTFCLTLPWDY